MNVQAAYKIWSEQYDTNENKTRDLEAVSLRETFITQDWNFTSGQYDLVTFSLVLEHIENLKVIFSK